MSPLTTHLSFLVKCDYFPNVRFWLLKSDTGFLPTFVNEGVVSGKLRSFIAPGYIYTDSKGTSGIKFPRHIRIVPTLRGNFDKASVYKSV